MTAIVLGLGLGLGLAACSDDASVAAPSHRADRLFEERVTAMVATDERLFAFTATELVSVPKAGGAATRITSRTEPSYTVQWSPLARGGGHVVAALDTKGPVVIVDEATSAIVSTWAPPPDFGTGRWVISSVGADASHALVGVADEDGSASIFAVSVADPAAPPDVVVTTGPPDAATPFRSYAVREIRADGDAVYYQLAHADADCATCGATRGGFVVDRLTGETSTELYRGDGYGQPMALDDDAVWLLSGDGYGTRSLTRIPKTGGASHTSPAPAYIEVFAAFGTTAFVPSSGLGLPAEIRSIDGEERVGLRPGARVVTFAVDTAFVYAAIEVAEQTCTGEGKGRSCTMRTVLEGIDRMPRAPL